MEEIPIWFDEVSKCSGLLFTRFYGVLTAGVKTKPGTANIKVDRYAFISPAGRLEGSFSKPLFLEVSAFSLTYGGKE